MPVSVTIWDGASCIGGNKILLEADGTNLLLDFGLNFKTLGTFFDEFLQPRSGKGVNDYIEFGLIPPIAGIYRTDLGCISEAQCIRYGIELEPVKIDGLLLTHAHVDHTGSISLLRKDIPIYCSLTTAVIAKVMQDVGASMLGQEVCYATPRQPKGTLLEPVPARQASYDQRRFIILDNLNINEQTTEFWTTVAGVRNLNSIPMTGCQDMVTQIGSLNVKYWPVDHSIPGSGAFAIETSAGWIVYTGDLRLHGTQSALTKQFMHEAAALHPFVLITEGTHPTGTSAPVTEQEVRQNILAAITASSASSRLVIADFGPRNVERLVSVAHIARETNRQLVVTAKDAYLIQALSRTEQHPEVAEISYKVWNKPRLSPAAWEKKLIEEMSSAQSVDATELRNSPGQYIVCFSYYDFGDLSDIQPDNAIYVYSTSEAYNEEMQLDLDKITAWVNHFHMEWVGYPGDRYGNGRQRGFHASGHIDGAGLIEMINRIRPKILIPVHTETPAFFIDNFSAMTQVLIPETGQRIDLSYCFTGRCRTNHSLLVDSRE